MEHFKNATARYLNENERKISTSLKQVPLVIEPAKKDGKINPTAFVSEHSKEILSELTKHGAVLLRGFEINSEEEFEQTIINIKGIEGMTNYFMAEPGRTVVEGLKYVHYTNKNYKTGGSYKFGSLHTENYYSSDVPHFIVFCCLKPSWFGGETGLVHMGNVYNSLNKDLKKKLEDKTFLAKLFGIKNIASRYSISENQVKEVFANLGIPINKADDGRELVSLYKPSVFYHPITNEPALIGNINGEVKGLEVRLKNLLLERDYSGLKWIFHRLLWQNPNLLNPGQMKKDIMNRLKGKKKPAISPQSSPKPAFNFPTDRMGSVFTDDDKASLAKSIKDNLIAFTWKKGDILLVDNFQIAHAGLPGFGPRTIRALLCNPAMIFATANDKGSLNLRSNTNHQSLATKMDIAKEQQGALG